MWGLAPLIATAAQISGGVGLSTLMVFMTGVECMAVLACSYKNKKAYWKTSVFDYLCGLLSVCGLIAWALTHNQDFAIFFSILADIFATIPTLYKAYHHPESENGPTFLLTIASCSLGVLCVQQPTFTAYAFITYLTCNSVLLCAMIYRRRMRAFFV
jgi:hypothetical protein